ncbi:kinase-like domain-containing protein [Chaetomium strumarium]|uniref:Kinase-like domain-containing protein n=1 Tax=Chaetomium strumarium TaxID=1170767 RepID=A0AAJ0M431_9PEZI|nr:kinase-like domain-containing protein [Chaetomium strumarium]
MSSTPFQPQSLFPSLSPDRGDEPSGHNAPFLDAAAAIAATEAVNKRNVLENSAIHLSSDLPHASGSTTSASPFQFRSYTTAPSPPVPALGPRLDSPSAVIRDPAEDSTSFTQSPVSLTYDDERAQHPPEDVHPVLPQISPPAYGYSTPHKPVRRPALSLQHKSSVQSLLPISRTPSLKTGSIHGVFGSGSAASSTVPSPIISAMGDVTPLPSPLLASDSPGPWKQMGRRTSGETAVSNGASAQTEPGGSTTHPTSTKKPYAGISSWPSAANDMRRHPDARLAEPQIRHTRNRSTSEYIPDPISVPKRMLTVSGTRVKTDMQNAAEGHMRREPHLSEARGLTPIEKPPTPPPSESSLSTTDLSLTMSSGSSTRSKQSRAEYFEAYGRYDKTRRRWRAVRVLGQGTFSQVYLATSHTSFSYSDGEERSPRGRLHTPEPYERRSLVAVKICEHGPRGGASEDRIEMSLKRELEIMKSIRHPSLVHLKAWSIEPTRAILVLSYYPGGDLFDVATRHRDALTPGLIRRIFAELVGAITYLHDQKIVHRDIKLENVLVNLPASELTSKTTTNWTTYPFSVITLTDLGLSRRIADDEKLETRCGSDDYAAPEVIMGQPYDGRATDAWSLGVLLYALLEARLPFDPPPCGPAGLDHAMQMRMRSRTSHRIARVEWRWFEYGVSEGEEGEGDHEADVGKFEAKGLTGAMEVVEGLLKRARSRWPLAKVAETEWVSGGIRVEGGIKFREEEEGEEVL